MIVTTSLLDRHADVDDELGVLATSSGSGIPTDLRSPFEGGRTSCEALDLRELVEVAEAADEVVDAAVGELAQPVGDLVGSPTGPQLERSIALESSG